MDVTGYFTEKVEVIMRSYVSSIPSDTGSCKSSIHQLYHHWHSIPRPVLLSLHIVSRSQHKSVPTVIPCSFLRWKRGDPKKLFLMELRRVRQGMPPMDGLGGGVGVGVPAGLSLGVCTGVPLGVGRGLPRGEG